MAITAIKNLADPRVKRTRQLLVDALNSLVDERGFDEVSVRDITERATVNRATFYAHYRDKTDLLVSSCRERVHEQLVASIEANSPPTAETLRRICATIFDWLEDTYGRCDLGREMGPVLEGMLYDELSVFIADWLRPNNSRSASAAVVSTELTARTISSAIVGSAVRWLASDHSRPSRQVIDQIVTLLGPGLLALYGASASGTAVSHYVAHLTRATKHARVRSPTI